MTGVRCMDEESHLNNTGGRSLRFNLIRPDSENGVKNASDLFFLFEL